MVQPGEPRRISQLWPGLVSLLESSPVVRDSLEPPAASTLLEEWVAVVGSQLPAQVVELYELCGGTRDFAGDAGFTLLPNWRILPVQEAIKMYPQRDAMVRLWEIEPVIPFARDFSGGFLVVPHHDGGTEVSLFFQDTPPMPVHDSIAGLLYETTEALEGRYERFRPELSTSGLHWLDTEEEEDFLAEYGGAP